MNEQHTITVTRYRDSAGQPTCAKDFPGGHVCVFYRTQRMGASETCVFAADHGRFTETLRRRPGRDKPGAGSLIPLSSCPVWSEK
jgi:hypothetical protein